MCEKAKCAAVLPCYADNERDLVRLVDDEMREAKLTIAPDARAALVSLIGGDRQASRSEIRKLALYAHGKDRVELDDVLAVVADASALALDAVVDAAFAGRTARNRGAVLQGALGRHLARHDPVLGAALRDAAAQGAARARRRRRTAFTAMRSFIPPIHFRRDAMVEAALKAWTAPRLAARHGAARRDHAQRARAPPALGDALAQRALLSIAVSARQRARELPARSPHGVRSIAG